MRKGTVPFSAHARWRGWPADDRDRLLARARHAHVLVFALLAQQQDRLGLEGVVDESLINSSLVHEWDRLGLEGVVLDHEQLLINY